MRDYVLDQIDVDEDDYWEALYALPLPIRDWLLWYVPGWWALPAGVFRRLLLTTAGFIVWDRMAPRVALRRAAMRLSLPPPRPTRRMPSAAPRPVFRAPLIRPVRFRPLRARPRFAPSFRRGGFRGGGFRGRFR